MHFPGIRLPTLTKRKGLDADAQMMELKIKTKPHCKQRTSTIPTKLMNYIDKLIYNLEEKERAELNRPECASPTGREA